MSAKKTVVKKKTFERTAGPMPVLRPAVAAATDPTAAKLDAPAATPAALQVEANRAVILRLVETVKGL